MLQKEKLENMKQDMKTMKINVLGISEVSWQGTRKITSRTFEIFYSEGIDMREEWLSHTGSRHDKDSHRI